MRREDESGSRMGLFVYLLHSLNGDVGIDLSRGETRMTKEGLDTSQIGTIIE